MTGGTATTSISSTTRRITITETGADIDEVQASISYSIASFANVENLTLLTGATTGTGNDSQQRHHRQLLSTIRWMAAARAPGGRQRFR